MMNKLIHEKIKCIKCKKEFSELSVKVKTEYYIKCCNEKKEIHANEIGQIRRNEYKCSKCNKKVECIYAETKCPYCTEINTKKRCYRKLTEKELEEKRKEWDGIMY